MNKTGWAKRPFRMALAIATSGVIAAGASTALAHGTVIGGLKSGDRIYSQNNTSAEVGTNRCRGANVNTTLTGGPYPNPTNINIVGTVSEVRCMADIRIVYARNGVGYSTSRVALTYGQTRGAGVTNAFRCYTELRVRRELNNDWLTVRLYNPQVRDASVRPRGCAAP